MRVRLLLRSHRRAFFPDVHSTYYNPGGKPSRIHILFKGFCMLKVELLDLTNNFNLSPKLYNFVALKQGLHSASWGAAWQPLLASVDGATNRATCLRGCRDPSHWLLLDQSEASSRNSLLIRSMDRTYRASQKLKNILYSDGKYRRK